MEDEFHSATAFSCHDWWRCEREFPEGDDGGNARPDPWSAGKFKCANDEEEGKEEEMITLPIERVDVGIVVNIITKL